MGLVHFTDPWSMDYTNGPGPWTTCNEWTSHVLPKWTTLKFVANINLTMLEPEQKMRSIDKHNYGTRAITIINDPDQKM